MSILIPIKYGQKMKYKRSSYTPKTNKLMKATEASKFLGLTINDFLDAERDGTIPASIFMGFGRRWSVDDLTEFKKNGLRDQSQPSPTGRS